MFFAVLLIFATPVLAQGTGGGFDLDRELAHFKDESAKGYLIWQYSGDTSSPLGDTDKYSLYRGDLGDGNDPKSICGVMKKWSSQYEFLGFNVYSLGQGRDGPLSSEQIADQLNVLAGCGTNVVRVHIGRSCPGSPNTTAACVKRILDGAGSAGVKLILTVGDFSNGGGGIPKLSRDQVESWYGGRYRNSQFPEYLRQTAAASAGNQYLYGIELANEPHCYDAASAVTAYNQWANVGVQTVRKDGIANIGLGQMANNPASSCDAPTGNLLPGNQAAGVTMVSSHYYTQGERDQADLAAAKVVSAGLTFYIGEAPVGIPIPPEDSPNTHVNENPDIADQQIVDSQSHDLCNEITGADGTTSTVCRNSDVMQFNGSFYAPDNYRVPELDPHANMLQRAGAATTPLAILNDMVDDTTCQRITTATRRCIYNDRGELVEDKISDHIIETDPLCWIPKIKQWSTEYSRYWGRDASSNHNHQSVSIIINKDAAHPCDYQRTGVDVNHTITEGTGRITFNLFQLLQTIIDAVFGTQIKGTMVEVPSKRTPFAEKGCAVGQCTAADLADSPIDPAAKAKYVNTAPFETSFHIPMLDWRPTNINGQLVNTFGTPDGGSFTNPTNTYFTKFTQNALGYVCSTLLPPSVQPDWCKPELTIINPAP